MLAREVDDPLWVRFLPGGITLGTILPIGKGEGLASWELVPLVTWEPPAWEEPDWEALLSS